MKKLNFIAIFMITMTFMPSIQTHEKKDAPAQQSLMAYIYNSFMPASTTATIPAACNTTKKVIIFDLNGVLCTTNKLRAAQTIGFDVISAYMIEHFKLPSSQELFKALEKVPAVSTRPVFYNSAQLPAIMVDWKTGLQDARDVQDAMLKHIADSKMTPAEKNMYTQTILMMTTPIKLISSKQIIAEGLQLVQTLKKLGYKIYILSNWDADSFPLFVQNFPELFKFEGKDLFDGIMISGKQHIAKPNKSIYQECLKKFEIDPLQAIFIDDAIENVRAADQLGIQSIHCKNKNIGYVKKQLIKMLNLQK
jgi:FMN phosphatase YigB (HAD superfamily)